MVPYLQIDGLTKSFSDFVQLHQHYTGDQQKQGIELNEPHDTAKP